MSGWHEAVWFLFLFGVALKATAVLGVAGLLSLLMRRRSAAARHIVWTAAAVSVLVLPLLSVTLPALRVPAPALLPASPQVVLFEGSMFKGSADAAVPMARATPRATRPLTRADWKSWLMVVWALGAAVALSQMLMGWAAVWTLRRKARPVSGLENELCIALSQALGVQRPVRVFEADAHSMPMTFGLLRSVILMPSVAAGWTEDRRRMVLLHELAHVRRGDAITHLLARMALTLYWWNPLAWMAWREFLKESERATDDLVLNAGAGAADYAELLLAVARGMQCSEGIEWAAVAMARRSQLEGRLAAILDSGIRRKTPGRGAALLAILAAIAFMAPLAALKAPAQAQRSTPVPAAAPQTPTPEDAAKAAEQRRKYDAYWLSVGGKLGAPDKEQLLKEALAAGPMMDLALAVEIDHFRVGPATYFVPVSLELPGSVTELAAKSGASATQLDFVGQIQDETHTVVRSLQDKINIKPNAGESSHKIQYNSGFTLGPGKYTLKLLARESASGEMGTFERFFSVPGPGSDSELWLSSVVFSSQRVKLGAALPKTEANPLIVGNSKVIPNIRREFRRDQSMYVNFDVCDAMPDPSNPQARNVKVSLALLDDGTGATAFETAPLVATQLAQTRPDAVPVNIEIPLKGIAPGRYSARLNVVDQAGGSSTSSGTPLVVTQ